MLSLIVAHSENRVIGINNRLPWNLPNDLRYFKKETMGKTIVMGRKTFESIGKPLTGRKNIVITRDRDWSFDGVDVIHSIEELKHLNGEVMIIGGANIYKQALPLVDQMYVTKIEHHFEGDAFFPEFSIQNWTRVKRVEGTRDKDNPYEYYFEVYQRNR